MSGNLEGIERVIYYSQTDKIAYVLRGETAQGRIPFDSDLLRKSRRASI
jgi:hypothetical protein